MSTACLDSSYVYYLVTITYVIIAILDLVESTNHGTLRSPSATTCARTAY